MATAKASVVIDRPVEEVFEYAIDPQKTVLWTDMSEAEQTSEGPVGVGTTYRAAGHFLGLRIGTTSEITHYEPNRRIDVKAATGPIKIVETDTFEPVGDGTRVTQAVEGASDGLFKLADPLLVRMSQGAMQGCLENLKDLLEAQA